MKREKNSIHIKLGCIKIVVAGLEACLITYTVIWSCKAVQPLIALGVSGDGSGRSWFSDTNLSMK